MEARTGDRKATPLRAILAEWTTLVLVLAAYLAYWLGRLAVGMRALWLVSVLLAFTLLAAGLVTFVILAATRRHTWRNTLGLLLAVFPLPAFTIPDLAKPEKTRRSVCAGKLGQIGHGALAYADDHDGAFPAELGLLFGGIDDGGHTVDAEVLVCPSRLEQLKETRGGADLRALPEARSYVYVSGLRKSDPEDYCLAFDEEWNHYRQVVHVLRVGGRVEQLTDADALHAELRAQAEALEAQGREMKTVRPRWSRHPDAPEGYFTPWTVRPFQLTVLVMGAACALAVAMELAVAYVRRRWAS